MTTRDQITAALLTEHLRYTPLTLLDDIINTVNELVYQAVNNIETALLSAPADGLGFVAPAEKECSVEEKEEALEAAARTEIEGGIVKLESLLNATIDKDFDKLEIYTLRNLLTVSNAKADDGLEDWVVLEHYKNLQLHHQQDSQLHEQQGPAPTNPQPTPQSLSALSSRLQETEKLHSLLVAEQARNALFLSKLNPLLSDPSSAIKTEEKNHVAPGAEASDESRAAPGTYNFLTSTPSAAKLGIGAQGRMAQNTQFTYSQLSALRDIVTELHPHLKQLKDNGGADIKVQEGVDERVAYIESQARKAMERAGVEPAADVEASGLGQQGEGRRARDELAALESVIGMLGTARAEAVDEDKMEE